VVINNRDSLSLLVGRTSDLFELGQTIGPTFAVAWAVRKGNRGLLHFLNAYLEQQYANGTMKTLQTKYNLRVSNSNRPQITVTTPLDRCRCRRSRRKKTPRLDGRGVFTAIPLLFGAYL
jgi:hypothetical protein